MYRKNGVINIEFTHEMCEIKAVREMICHEYIEGYNQLSMLVINSYQLSKINDKYVQKFRNYDDNYYSRKKIKEEEILFLKYMLAFLEWNTKSNSTIHLNQRVSKAIELQVEKKYKYLTIPERESKNS